MERIERLHRHLVTTFWTENGWTLTEATHELNQIDWEDCGGLEENIASFFTDSERAHLCAVCSERLALMEPWLSLTEIEKQTGLLLDTLSLDMKRGLLDLPCCPEYFKAPVH